ncbi:ABC transporter transmembrane domain-containing protein [soil metagenome]
MPDDAPDEGDQKPKRKGLAGLKGSFEIYGYLGRHKAIFIPSLIALFITAALALAFPYFLKELIGDPADALREGVDVGLVMEKIDRTILLLLGALALQATISFFRVQGFIRSGEAALNDFRKDLFAKLVRLPMGTFQEQRSGALSNRVAADLAIMRDTLLTTVPQMARQSVIFVGGMVFIFVASTKLSLIMLACIPLVIGAVALFGRKVRTYSKSAQAALADSGIVVEETVQGIADVKAFNNEPFEERRYGGALDRFLDVTVRGAMVRAAFVSFIVLVLFGTIAGVTWVGARMMASGEITTKQFTSFILFSIFVGASLGSFPEIIAQLQKTAGATESLQELMRENPEDTGSDQPATLEGGIAAHALTFRYPSRPDVPVLDGLEFSVAPGERVALVGPSGAGKSTVFALLLGFYRPDGGALRFDGQDARAIALGSLRGQMAIVPQEVLLFGGSIRENIGYGKPGASHGEIEEAAKKANAHDFVTAFPEGYDTLVGPRGVKLSGGQRQRIAIARAILADPKILLLDEATSALDSESERLVQEALERLMVGRTSIIIAHRLSTVRHCDKIFVLNAGRIVESGTHDVLVAQNGVYRLLAETQLA